MQHYAIEVPLATSNIKVKAPSLYSTQKHLEPGSQEPLSCLVDLFVHDIGGLIDKLAGLYEGHGPRIRHNNPSALRDLQLDVTLIPSIA